MRYKLVYVGPDYEGLNFSKIYDSKEDAIVAAKNLLTESLSIGIIGEDEDNRIIYSLDEDWNPSVSIVELP